ncbi:MAG TPA: ribokinase [Acidimicrobiia bacterium]|nr:ribokinase [Acidimicrobiia bacterium]
MPAVTVLGSVNLDLVVRLPRLPAPGETVTGGEFGRHPGGKGANQALAARRLGADVNLVAAIGDDEFAMAALALLRAEGVGLENCKTIPNCPTGVAVILVGSGGENLIGVAPGANARLASDLGLDPNGPVICQLEVPIETVTQAAVTTSGFFCVNAAPAREVPVEVWHRADVVVVNETERDHYGHALDDCRGLVVVTMGKAGAIALRDAQVVAQATPPPVKAIDTVGAGDAFVATLAVSLLEGLGLEFALKRACAAGALATTRAGAQPSLPTAAEIDAIMSR